MTKYNLTTWAVWVAAVILAAGWVVAVATVGLLPVVAVTGLAAGVVTVIYRLDRRS